MENYQNSFSRGVLSLAILALLRREDMYGYQLVQAIEHFSEGRLVTQEGSLYPVLYKLQEQKLVSCERKLVGKRMARIYYHLEPAGFERFKELRQEYEELTAGMLQIIHGGDGENESE